MQRVIFLLTLGFMVVSLVIPVMGSASEPGKIALVKPVGPLSVDLMTALQQRRSTKAYEVGEISLEDLGHILWAANGVNREDGKRTAPAPRAQNFIQIYVTSDHGNFLYSPVDHHLLSVSVASENLILPSLKQVIGLQEYVKSAGHVLLLVANLKDYAFDDPRERILDMGRITAGCIAQNIYLMAAAKNLGAVVAASFDEAKARAGLGLTADQVPLFIIPVGMPKQP